VPARLRDLARALRKFGIVVERPKRGSHWKAVGPDGRVYPLPAGNAEKTELSEVYVKGVCFAFGLDEAEFRKLL
jgi:hypothetical protein